MKRRRFLQLAGSAAVAIAGGRRATALLGGSSGDSKCRTVELMLEKKPDDGRLHWLVDGQPHPEIESLCFEPGGRIRLRMMNATNQPHVVWFRSHKVALRRVNQPAGLGGITATVRLDRYSVIDADVITSNYNLRK